MGLPVNTTPLQPMLCAALDRSHCEVFGSPAMSSKSRGAGTSKDVPPAKLVQTVLEATSCSEEEAKQMLLDCNNDCNEAVNRLLDGGAFAAVINKKQRRKQVRSDRMTYACIACHGCGWACRPMAPR